MDKIKKIIVFVTIGIIIALIVACLVFALLGNNAAFMACAWGVVVFPCLLYAMMLIYKVLSKR